MYDELVGYFRFFSYRGRPSFIQNHFFSYGQPASYLVTSSEILSSLGKFTSCNGSKPASPLATIKMDWAYGRYKVFGGQRL